MRIVDFSVVHRVTALAVAPLTAAVLLTVPLAGDRVAAARQSSQAAVQLEKAREVGGLVADLQRERLLAGAYLATPDSDANTVVLQSARTDGDLSDLLRKGAPGVTPDLTDLLGTTVEELARARDWVLERRSTVADVNDAYGRLISALIDGLRLTSGDGFQPRGGVARELATVDALLRVHEDTSSLGAALLAVAATPEQAERLMADVERRSGAQSINRERFFQFAGPSEIGLFQQIESGAAAVRITAYADGLALWAHGAWEDGYGEIQWPSESATANIVSAADSQDQLRLLAQNKIAKDASTAATEYAAFAERMALTFVLAAVSLAGVMIWLTTMITRSIVKPLRFLQGAAARVAEASETELTRVVEEGTQPSQDTSLSVRLKKVEVRSTDELGRLARDFNRVQHAAVKLIERQVMGSRNASAMLGNVGRRTQNLAALQLSVIDAMERVETDPSVLERLYRLDHLTSRLRRYADSLVVLSGWAEPAFINAPVALGDLTRSALSKIEGFERVQLMGTFPPFKVSTRVAADLALMIAELVDNATSYSPPYTPVEIFAEPFRGGRCLIRIVDHGVGMSEARCAEENVRLERQERLDLAPTELLGLFVVGRLSRRHMLGVQLCRTPGGGLTAEILLPAAALDHGPMPSTQHQPPDAAVQEPWPSAFPADGVSAQPVSHGLAPDAHRSPRTSFLSLVPPTAHGEPEQAATAGAAPPAVQTGFEEQRPLPEAGPAEESPRGLAARPFDWFDAQLRSEIRQALTNEPALPGSPPPERQRHLALAPVSAAHASLARAVAAGPRAADRATPAPAQSHDEESAPPTATGPVERSTVTSPPRLVRRVPGAQMPKGAFLPTTAPLQSKAADPEAARSMIEDFEAGIARALQAEFETRTPSQENGDDR
ncbi:nitrate- and nitrite sensing domain-containing protein [Streptomyces sp. NPDC098781]|uniref:sensor histidine kinase n=1 Tax=Streptomyces sp. NPDC098781 TaxID=3366097 RepID=UPI00382CFD3E